MRTTLNLDDDLVEALRRIARAHGIPVGRIVSELVRQGLPVVTNESVRNGVRLLTPRPGRGPDMAVVNSLRDGG